ncbi:MAG: hypothetical protein JO359_05210 [Candidatus Eremiobacteraeota bacterium]|nr:hypothetical protein [Candidatus Eremiobacteraeota bacterium]
MATSTPPLSISHQRTFTGTKRRIFQLLVDMGTSADAVWPFASQPFMRSPGPLVPGRTEEWHSGVHAVLEEVVPEERIVWKFLNDGVAGTHGYYITADGKQTTVTHRIEAELSEPEGRLFWRRFEDVHERTMNALFDKIARVLKR